MSEQIEPLISAEQFQELDDYTKKVERLIYLLKDAKRALDDVKECDINFLGIDNKKG